MGTMISGRNHVTLSFLPHDQHDLFLTDRPLRQVFPGVEE